MPFSKIKTSTKLIILSITTFVMSLGFFVYFLSTTVNLGKKTVSLTYNSDQVIVAVNKQRQKENLKPLITNTKLTQAANKKAENLAQNQYFSHINPVTKKTWSDFINESNYNYLIAGENLANGFYDTNNMVTAWMNSPSHRQNILNENVEETGIGISFGKLQSTPTIFVVQMFGKQE